MREGDDLGIIQQKKRRIWRESGQRVGPVAWLLDWGGSGKGLSSERPPAEGEPELTQSPVSKSKALQQSGRQLRPGRGGPRSRAPGKESGTISEAESGVPGTVLGVLQDR